MAYLDDVSVPVPTGPPTYDDFQWHEKPSHGPLTGARERDFTGPAHPNLAPSLHPPGSPGRVEDYAARYVCREDLFCARDLPLAEADGYGAAGSGGEFYRVTLYQAAPAADGTHELFATQARDELPRHRSRRPSDVPTDASRALDAGRKRQGRVRQKEGKLAAADAAGRRGGQPRARKGKRNCYDVGVADAC